MINVLKGYEMLVLHMVHETRQFILMTALHRFNVKKFG